MGVRIVPIQLELPFPDLPITKTPDEKNAHCNCAQHKPSTQKQQIDNGPQDL